MIDNAISGADRPPNLMPIGPWILLISDSEKPDSYYFKVDVKAQDDEDDSLLYAPNLILTVSIIAMITLINRRWISVKY